MGRCANRLCLGVWAVCLVRTTRADLASSGVLDGVAGGAPSTEPVANVLTRVLGAETASIFDLSLDPTMPQGFTLSTTPSPLAMPAGASNRSEVTVKVTASGLPELAYGCAYYLRTYASMSFAWERTGGNQVAPPPNGFPPVPKPVTVAKTVKWSYYQNVCTQSYSMWWWDWPRWEREIDWMALWGINLVLAYTGQEEVFRQVYNSIGVNDSILNQTFDGPAFLTWSRGQGTFGVGGPLPNYWMTSQHDLQVKIMNRLRELGMQGILPGFQGNVPKAMPELFPDANTSNGWLDGLDPLFDKIGRGVAAGMQADFGPATFVEADGWFSLETGPWLSSQSAARDPVDDSAEGSCLGGFKIPSEDEARTRGEKIRTSLTSAAPDAVWVYQGYPWFRVYSQGASCNQTALRYFIKGFTDAIPKDKLLVLDLIADSPGNALWRYPPSPDTGPFTRNASLIWCALNNWGGAVHLGGDLTFVLNETRAAMATDAVVGVGLTPEGIDNSPAYFSLVLDAPWTAAPTAEDWLLEWGAGRCGRSDVAAANQAYSLLFETVYRPGQKYLWCCSNPHFCPTVTPGEGVDRPGYNISMLRQALELMVIAAPSCNTSAFLFDLVDVAREWLSMGPCLTVRDKVDPHADPSNLTAQVTELLDVFADVDRMMATDSGFLFGRWLQQSRAVSDWDGSGGTLADFYEWNSRMQVSTWAGGYSRREWSGVVSTYYAERVNIWLNYTIATNGASNDAAGTYTAYPNMDCNFDDLGRAKCADSLACTLAEVEAECDSMPACIGFNLPGAYLKKACNDFKAASSSTFYFKPGHSPPPQRSSCLYGYCTPTANGTHNGLDCGGQCPAMTPLPQQLAQFAAKWQNTTWNESQLPATPSGDPVAIAKELLAKYT